MFYLIIFLIFVTLIFNAGKKNKKKKQTQRHRATDELLKPSSTTVNNLSLLKQLDNHIPTLSNHTKHNDLTKKPLGYEDILSSYNKKTPPVKGGTRLYEQESHLATLPPRQATKTQQDTLQRTHTQALLKQHLPVAQPLNDMVYQPTELNDQRNSPLQALLKKINNPASNNATSELALNDKPVITANELPAWRNKRHRVFSALTFESAGIACIALSIYYPKRFQNLSLSDKLARNIIYDFKEGASESTHISSVAKMTAIIKQSLAAKDLQNCYFFCLPAASQARHDLRYRQFSKDVSTLCGMADFNQHITFKSDRKQKHIHGVGGEDEFAHVNIPYGQLAGKNVVIFDDIITSGRSLATVSRSLRASGANVLLAVFLGKTYNENYSDNTDKKHFVLTR